MTKLGVVTDQILKLCAVYRSCGYLCAARVFNSTESINFYHHPPGERLGYALAKTGIKVRSTVAKLKAIRIFGFKLLIGPIYGFQRIQQRDQVGVSHYVPGKRVISERWGWEPERKV